MSEPLTFGSLFAGIGGMDLGLERAGMRCVWQVEIDDYARRVLAKHWPTVRRWDDVQTFPPGDPAEWQCDLICGGFPCQDISNAGRRAGIEGERSGLWAEFSRVIGLVRPGLVLVENVAALLGRGMGRVLGDLANLGFDAEWGCIPAAAVGAPPSPLAGLYSGPRGTRRGDMRINIYTEELTNEVEVVEKNGFHGLRFYLASPEELHHDATDDDRSAITFWGLRTVAPLMERVMAVLRDHRESRGGLPVSVNEAKRG